MSRQLIEARAKQQKGKRSYFLMAEEKYKPTTGELISIVIPTRNEEQNIARLLEWGLWQACRMHEPKYKYEAVVVDDGDDRTAAIAEEMGAKVIRGQRMGLGQAILDGIAGTTGSVVVVMDADLSHNPHAVPGLLRPILYQGYDMVIGSRYVKGGQVIGWSRKRRLTSAVACAIAYPLTWVRDSTSGFFAFRREILEGVELRADSWKIMLEVLTKCRPVYCELPIEFKDRTEGESKFRGREVVRYLSHLVKLFLWRLRNKPLHNPRIEEAHYEWHSFYRGWLPQRWWKHRVAEAVWEFIPEGSAVLEVGCGSSPIISRYPEAVGVDVNGDKVEFMKKKLPLQRFEQMSGEKLGFEDESFDYVLCVEVLEHLRQPEKAVREIARVLKKGGKAVIATPDYSRWWWKIAERFTAYKEEHVTQFSRKELEMLCRRYRLVSVGYKYVAGCDLVECFRKGG